MTEQSQIITENYRLLISPNNLTAFSAARIPFDHLSPWQKAFRDALGQALLKMTALPGTGISAAYGSLKGRDDVDVENALFYNIGPARFKHCARHSLAFRHVPPNEVSAMLPERGGFSHCYRYEINPLPDGTTKAPVSWRQVPIASLRGSHQPYEYWLALRQNLSAICAADQGDILGDFGLEIEIDSPEQQPLNLANPMKALLDGVICAFHRMPDLHDSEKLSLAAARLGCPMEMLLDKRLTFLGEVSFIRPYRNHVFWNPQDQRCKRACLSIQYGKPAWQMSGKLYPL